VLYLCEGYDVGNIKRLISVRVSCIDVQCVHWYAMCL